MSYPNGGEGGVHGDLFTPFIDDSEFVSFIDENGPPRPPGPPPSMGLIPPSHSFEGFDGGRGTGAGWQKAALARGAGRLALKGGLALGQLGAKGLVKGGTGALALSGPALGCSIQAGSRLLKI